jgi:O-antigen/teichoic acid export membrane protein
MVRTSAHVGQVSRLAAARAAQLTKRLGWGIADQGLSSITNFAIGIIIVRLLGVRAFGAFSLAFTTYTVALNVSRGLATDPLVIRHSGTEPAAWRRATTEAAGAALVVGMVAGVVSVLVGTLLGRALEPSVGEAFVALGVTLPGLLVQDAWRFAFFAAGRAGQAFLNDLVWALSQLVAFALIISGGVTGVAPLVLAWGGAASVAGVVGVLQARVWPRPALVGRWVGRHWELGSRYVLENLSISGEYQLRAYGLGAIADLQAVGSLRAAELLLGPLRVIQFGVELVALPDAVRIARSSVQRLIRTCWLIGGGLAGLMMLWGGLMLLLSDRVGVAILGSSWPATQPLLLPVTIFAAGVGLTCGATVGLRALAAARRSLRARLVSSSVRLLGALAGAAVAGAGGAAWGLASGSVIAVAVWWWQFTRELREYAEPHERVSN